MYLITSIPPAPIKPTVFSKTTNLFVSLVLNTIVFSLVTNALKIPTLSSLDELIGG